MAAEEEVHRNLVDQASYQEEAVEEGHQLLEELEAEDHRELVVVEEAGLHHRSFCFVELEGSSSAGASN